MKKVCRQCGQEYERKNAREYCEPCSVMIRKALNKKRNIAFAPKGNIQRKERYASIIDQGKVLNQYIPEPFFDAGNGHGIRIVIPFSRAFSKNKVMVARGRIVRWRVTNEAKKELVKSLSLVPHQFFQGKIYLKILVRQPDHMGDALNYLDNIADAIQDGIGVNDRWFAIRSLDWMIDKNNPGIEISIIQKATEHHALCRACGREVPFSAFNEGTRKRLERQILEGGKAGRRECLECMSIKT